MDGRLIWELAISHMYKNYYNNENNYKLVKIVSN